MNDDYRQPAEQPMYEPDGSGGALRSGLAALPAVTFTASILFDVLALIADSSSESTEYARRATDLLKVGLGATFASLGLEIIEALRLPPSTGSLAQRKLAVNAGVIAIYLLQLATREKQLAAGSHLDAAGEAGPLALSLSGLGLLTIAGRLH